jgi:hypothetical protein
VAFSLFLVTPWLAGRATHWLGGGEKTRRHGLVERLLFYAFFFFCTHNTLLVQEQVSFALSSPPSSRLLFRKDPERLLYYRCTVATLIAYLLEDRDREEESHLALQHVTCTKSRSRSIDIKVYALSVRDFSLSSDQRIEEHQ